MPYLLDFIQSLNQKEKLQLKALPVIGKEREVLEVMLANKGGELNVLHALEKVRISRTHFDKISSVVLNKCFVFFVPNGENAVLGFLVNKGLSTIFLHQIKVRERSWKKEPPSLEEKESFYEYSFRMVCRLPAATLGKIVIARLFASKYLKTIQDKQEKKIQQIFTESRLLICKVEIEGVTRRIDIPAVAKKIQKNLYDLKQKEIPLKNPYATYSANLANIFYYNLITPEKSFSFLKEALEKLPHITTRINESEQINLHLKYAEYLFYTNQFNEAYKKYVVFFGVEKTHKLITNTQRSKFIQLCIILEKFQEAENEIQYVYAQSSEVQVHSFTLMYALCSIRLYLLTSNMERAFYYLQMMKEKLSKKLLVIYEVEIRNLEAAYFYLNKDFDFSIYTAKKNLKYFASKSYLKEEPSTSNFSKLLLMADQYRKKKAVFNYEAEPLAFPFLYRELKYYKLLLDKIVSIPY